MRIVLFFKSYFTQELASISVIILMINMLTRLIFQKNGMIVSDVTIMMILGQFQRGHIIFILKIRGKLLKVK